MSKTDFLKELPKCEHHVHLEGTLEPSLLFKLAERNTITLPEWFPKSVEHCNDRYNRFADLQDFLDHYYVGMSVLIHEDDFYDLAMDYFRRSHHDGCHHSEAFFDPQAHLERGISIETVIKGFERACKDASTQYDVTNKLIMCLLRHLPAASGLEVIEQALPYYHAGTVHGLGLDSSEKPFPPHIFDECYKVIRESFPHVGLTAHAGEEGDHTYVESALETLQVSRIDHGINSRHSDDLLDRLARDQTMLTVCPLSNVKLRCVKDVSELPIREFLLKGVPFSINSDDPAYFGGYILDNYLEVDLKFNLSVDQWSVIATNGINGSWCDDARKAELRSKVAEVLEKYVHLKE